MLVLTFQELGIDVADYNGMHVSKAVPAIINHAADRITMAQYQHPVTAIETLYDWAYALVNFTLQRIEIPAAPFDTWATINS
jgi:hypothetical protein